MDWGYRRYTGGQATLDGYSQPRWCFDSEAVRQRVAPHLRAAANSSSVRLIDVYARPGKAIDICHVFSKPEGDAAAVTVRCSPTGRGGHNWRKALKGVSDPGCVAELDAESFVWIFPEDADLPLLDLVQRRFDDKQRRVRLLSYRRGGRCVFLDHEAGAVFKIQPHAAAGHARMTALFSHPGRRFVMPEPLGCDPGQQMRSERFAPGSSFDLRVNAGNVQAAARALMSALAGLHSIAAHDISPALHPLHPRHVMQRFDAMFLRRLELTGLGVAGSCRRLSEVLSVTLPAPPSADRVLHGDMHSGNALFHGGGAVLIDLDEMAAGDPVYDLAMFASGLVLIAVLQPAARQACLAAVEAIPDLYGSAGGRAVSAPSYAWHVAALTASRQIKSCINHAAPFIEEVTLELAAIALRIAKGRKIEAGTLTVGH